VRGIATAGEALGPGMGENTGMAVQLLRFMLVGALSTGANALFFLVLRTWLDPVPANLVALVASTLLSTEVNRHFTFGGAPSRPLRTYVQNGGTVLFYAFYSSAVLLLLGMVLEEPNPEIEAASVAAASLLGGACRFLVMRYWVFTSPTAPAAQPSVPLGHGPADRPSHAR
jgi:putative flippase GtrA